MNLTSLISEQLDREAALSRRALERVPAGKNDWKPHAKSMPLGVLAHLIAVMPSWVTMMIKQDELDIKPAGGPTYSKREFNSSDELIEAHDKGVAEARRAVAETTEEHLGTTWRLLEGGKVVAEYPRYLFIMDYFGHLAHHRGQLTVYQRLNEVDVPAIYGPSADDHRF